jgi:hypothetical protein
MYFIYEMEIILPPDGLVDSVIFKFLYDHFILISYFYLLMSSHFKNANDLYILILTLCIQNYALHL